MRLPLEDGNEPVDRVGVFDIPEQLAASPAGDVAPVQRGLRVCGRHAPPLPRGAHRGPVSAGEHRQPPVGNGKAVASIDMEIDREAQPLEPHEDAGEHRTVHSKELSQVGGSNPGPVREQVECVLLGGLEQGGQHPAWDFMLRPFERNLTGQEDLRRLLRAMLRAASCATGRSGGRGAPVPTADARWGRWLRLLLRRAPGRGRRWRALRP